MDMNQFDHEMFISQVRVARLNVIRSPSKRQKRSPVMTVPLWSGQRHGDAQSVDVNYADQCLDMPLPEELADEDYGW